MADIPNDDLKTHSMSSGLHKALVVACNELVSDYITYIKKAPSDFPDHKQDWRKGAFSYLHVEAVEFYTRHMFYEFERFIVATNKPRKGKKQVRDTWSFVRCELTTPQKVVAKDWMTENEKDMGIKIHSLMAEGHKVSISLSQEKDTFTATASGQEHGPNYMLMLTARHKDWWVALQTLIFKHEELFDDGIWTQGDTEDDGWG